MKTLAPLAAATVAIVCSSAFAQIPLSGPQEKMTVHTPESLAKALEERKAKEGNGKERKAEKQDPAPAMTPSLDPGAPDTAEGRFLPKVLLLRNGQMLTGEVMKDAAGYLFRSNGARMRWSLGQVEAVADSTIDIYRYKRNRIAPNDLSERIELAKLCLRWHLEEEAKAETAAVLAIDPQFAPAKKLLKDLRPPEEQNPSRPESKSVAGSSGIAADAGGFGEESIKLFTSQVQLILINKCGKCHGNPRHESEFRLSSTNARRITPTTTSKNFKAAELMVDLKNPAKSKLLEMAITPHGGPKVTAAAFGGPNDEGFKALRKWSYTLAKNWQDAFADPEGLPQIANNSNVPDLPARRPTAATQQKKTAVAQKMKPAPEKPGFGSAAADDAPAERPSLLKAPKKTAKPKKEEGDPLNPDAFNEAGGGGDASAPATVPDDKPKARPSSGTEKPKSSGNATSSGDLFKDAYGDVPPSWKNQKKSD